MLLSLFCGAGGLDLGFERAGFEIGLAFDKKADSVKSYNQNRESHSTAHCVDVKALSVEYLDALWGQPFRPAGLIGGPPCQSFSEANRSIAEDDPRHQLPLVYARLLKALNERHPLGFFVMENVKGLMGNAHRHRLELFRAALTDAGFNVFETLLNAADYSTPQNRKRLFLVGLNKTIFSDLKWRPPEKSTPSPCNPTVASVLRDLPEPVRFSKGLKPAEFPHHRNHWCMAPKSSRFSTPGKLIEGSSSHRSFKTLSWEKPSLTVAYGHREVHVHPDCHRRLSVYEAMLLQGFPHSYVLSGTLTSQIDQVSEAVPPPLAEAVASSIMSLLVSSGMSKAA